MKLLIVFLSRNLFHLHELFKKHVCPASIDGQNNFAAPSLLYSDYEGYSAWEKFHQYHLEQEIVVPYACPECLFVTS